MSERMILLKGIPIKFRGKAENGEYVYGDLMQGNYDESAFHIKPRKKRPVYVDKNSVAQLVGYDSNGDEVYEGDIVNAFLDDEPEPVYDFYAALLNNFLATKNLKNVKQIVRRNAE